MRRPRKPCVDCGRPTKVIGYRCRPCGEREELPDGRWVPNGRGIVVFRKADGLAIERGDAA